MNLTNALINLFAGRLVRSRDWKRGLHIVLVENSFEVMDKAIISLDDEDPKYFKVFKFEDVPQNILQGEWEIYSK